MAATLTNEAEFDNALALRLPERLSHRDLRILELCWSAQPLGDIVRLSGLTLDDFAWLVHYKLLRTRNDTIDNMRAETTTLGRDVFRHMKQKTRTGRQPTVST